MRGLSFSIAGKVFLLGEYAVLDRRPALVYALPPRFSLSTQSAPPTVFHPQSPAGRLRAYAIRAGSWPWAENAGPRFRDALGGSGGFGGSTAEFALLYRAIAAHADWPCEWPAVWRLYRELNGPADSGFAPSGADLVAQWQGGLSWIDLGAGLARDVLPAGGARPPVWILSATGQAGRKVSTHEHLAKLRAIDGDAQGLRILFDRLTDRTCAGLACLEQGDWAGLGEVFDRYGDELRAHGLELGATTADRAALRVLPGVLGVKGTGAMQADALALVMDMSMDPEIDKGDPGGAKARLVRQVAESRGLRVVTEGLHAEPGISTT